jgi:hypothetical protein
LDSRRTDEAGRPGDIDVITDAEFAGQKATVLS